MGLVIHFYSFGRNILDQNEACYPSTEANHCPSVPYASSNRMYVLVSVKIGSWKTQMLISHLLLCDVRHGAYQL